MKVNVSDGKGVHDFGSSCWRGEKLFCCKHAAQDLAFEGKWLDTRERKLWTCKYTGEGPYVAPCGLIKCGHVDMGRYKEFESNISGRCDMVMLDDYIAYGEPGYFTLKDVNEDVVGWWIKYPPN
ncbi:hypothetical protein Ddc_02359 [Ditylenchus destructor]|nr:hypothetical protein Ddc_02359 [Ditylenchus destructor]